MPPVVTAFLRGLGRRVQQALLTLGAALGVVSVALTVGAPLVHVRPLIFLSGSMSPTITTGSLGLAHSTPAADLRVGDVITVPAGDNTYITHRIIEITHHDAIASLRLKGDANKDPDPTVHQVLDAPRLFFSVPYAGSVVAWFSRTPGVYLLGGYVVFALASLRRRREQLRRDRDQDDADEQDDARDDDQDDRNDPGCGTPVPGPRPRRRLPKPGPRTTAAAMVAASTVIASPAQALFLDSVPVTGTTVGAVTPTTPVASCGALGNKFATVNWTSSPAATGYRVFYDAGGVTTQDVPATQTSMTFTNKQAGNFSVRAIYGSTSWLSGVSNSLAYESTGQGTCV